MPTTALEMTSKVGYGQRYYMQRTFTVSSGGRSLIFLVAEGGIEPPTQRFSVAHLYCNSLKKQHYYKQDDPYNCIIMAMYVMFSRAKVARATRGHAMKCKQGAWQGCVNTLLLYFRCDTGNGVVLSENKSLIKVPSRKGNEGEKKLRYGNRLNEC